MTPHERIGRYEVLRKIATGGMAELFLAKHVGMEGFEKVVAIKRILSHLAYDEEFINMFRDEARLVAKLSHQNIVQIYDLGKSNDSYFIAMEYIPGRNLASVAKKAKGKNQALPPVYIARCIAQACEALHYAHTRTDLDGRPMGIVHRDVSPQNIIVAFSGGVKLVDFGIAKAATKIAHTRAGVLKGKYAYMSPEQIRGEEIDARSDLFSVGIVLYELLCGRRPFEKENSIQTLKAIVQEQHVDCRVLNPAIPDPLAAVINKALTKNRDERYHTAQDVQLALEDFVASTGERCNNVVIGEWLSTLFEDELERGKGATITFKGVGDIILPPDEKKEPEGEAVDLSDDADVSAPGVSSGSASAPDPNNDLIPLARGRGGGSVEAKGAPIPEAPSLRHRGSSRAGRSEMLEEGVIERGRGGGRQDEDEATALAADDRLPDEVEAERAVGRAAAGPLPEDSRSYEEGLRSSAPPAGGGKYDDSQTEHVPEDSPLWARLGADRQDPDPAVAPPDLPPSEPPPEAEPTLDLSLASIRSEAAPLPSIADPALIDSGDDAIRDAMAEALAAALASEQESAEATVDPDRDQDLWNEKTTASPSEDEASSPDVRLIADDDDPWEERTTGMPEELASAGATAAVDGSAARAALDEISMPEVEADEVDEMWGEKTTATPGDSSDAGSGGVNLFPDGPWSDKTMSATDDGEDLLIQDPHIVPPDETVGMSVEEIAARLHEVRAEPEPRDESGIDLFGGSAGRLPADDTSELEADATEWAKHPRETNGWQQARASLTVGDEPELPSGIDRDHNVESDSRTVAATASAYEAEGIEIPASGAFSYDGEEASTAATGRFEPASVEARGKEKKIGAIKLAKMPAAPRGGIREVEPAAIEERTGEIFTDDARGMDPPTEELTQDKLDAARRLSDEPVLPERKKAKRTPPPISMPIDDDESTREEPPLPPGGSLLGDLSELEDLFAPKVTAPLSKPDPLAGIGSTRVPPVNVSLSEMLVDNTGQGRAVRRPADPRPPRGQSDPGTRPRPRSLPPAPPPADPRPAAAAPPPKAAPRAASLNRSVLRDIKEVRRQAEELEPQLADVPQPGPSSASVLGLGAPVGGYQGHANTAPLAHDPLSMRPPQAPPRARLSLIHMFVIAFCAIAISAVSAAFIYVKLRSPSLEITTNPPGAYIYMDGKLLEGTTPLAIPIEPETEYKLKIVRDGYYAQTQPVRIPKGKRAWKATFNLKELPRGEATATP